MRIKKIFLCLVLAFITCASFAHKIPDSAWQKGVLKDVQLVQETSIMNTVNGVRGGTYTVQHLVIETPEMIYEVVPFNGTTRIAIEKGRFDLTVNSAYLFAIENAEIYVRDINGKEGKFRIVKKALKQPVPEFGKQN
jgi:hypothetical protein